MEIRYDHEHGGTVGRSAAHACSRLRFDDLQAGELPSVGAVVGGDLSDKERIAMCGNRRTRTSPEERTARGAVTGSEPENSTQPVTLSGAAVLEPRFRCSPRTSAEQFTPDHTPQAAAGVLQPDQLVGRCPLNPSQRAWSALAFGVSRARARRRRRRLCTAARRPGSLRNALPGMRIGT